MIYHLSSALRAMHAVASPFVSSRDRVAFFKPALATEDNRNNRHDMTEQEITFFHLENPHILRYPN